MFVCLVVCYFDICCIWLVACDGLLVLFYSLCVCNLCCFAVWMLFLVVTCFCVFVLVFTLFSGWLLFSYIYTVGGCCSFGLRAGLLRFVYICWLNTLLLVAVCYCSLLLFGWLRDSGVFVLIVQICLAWLFVCCFDCYCFVVWIDMVNSVVFISFFVCLYVRCYLRFTLLLSCYLLDNWRVSFGGYVVLHLFVWLVGLGVVLYLELVVCLVIADLFGFVLVCVGTCFDCGGSGVLLLVQDFVLWVLVCVCVCCLHDCFRVGVD